MNAAMIFTTAVVAVQTLVTLAGVALFVYSVLFRKAQNRKALEQIYQDTKDIAQRIDKLEADQLHTRVTLNTLYFRLGLSRIVEGSITRQIDTQEKE